MHLRGDRFTSNYRRKSSEEGMCGRLEKSMYGTRDAAQNWEEHYAETMAGL